MSEVPLCKLPQTRLFEHSGLQQGPAFCFRLSPFGSRVSGFGFWVLGLTPSHPSHPSQSTNFTPRYTGCFNTVHPDAQVISTQWAQKKGGSHLIHPSHPIKLAFQCTGYFNTVGSKEGWPEARNPKPEPQRTGYFNTVGSKEGWQPATFVSSRSKPTVLK